MFSFSKNLSTIGQFFPQNFKPCIGSKWNEGVDNGSSGSTQPEVNSAPESRWPWVNSAGEIYRNPGQVVPESTLPLYIHIYVPSLVGVPVRLIVCYVISNGSSIKF